MSGSSEGDVVEVARRVLTTRASVLRRRADDLTIRIKDAWGADVRIVPPEAVVMMRTAALFDECAADAIGLAGREAS